VDFTSSVEEVRGKTVVGRKNPIDFLSFYSRVYLNEFSFSMPSMLIGFETKLLGRINHIHAYFGPLELCHRLRQLGEKPASHVSFGDVKPGFILATRDQLSSSEPSVNL